MLRRTDLPSVRVSRPGMVHVVLPALVPDPHLVLAGDLQPSLLITFYLALLGLTILLAQMALIQRIQGRV